VSTIKDLGPAKKGTGGLWSLREWARSFALFTLTITLPTLLYVVWLENVVGPSVSDGPIVLELSQTDQATCDELAGYYEQVTNGASLAEVQRTTSTLNTENTYPVRVAYEAYEDAEALHQDSLAGAATTGEADDAVKGARFAYVQACIL